MPIAAWSSCRVAIAPSATDCPPPASSAPTYRTHPGFTVAALPVTTTYGFLLVGNRFGGSIDDEHFDGDFARFELQPELFLQSGENGRPAVCLCRCGRGGRIGFFWSPAEFEIEIA